MAVTRRIQHIRGTTAQNNAFTGRSGELSVDTETNELRVHDGSTAGGHRVYTKTEVDTLLASKSTQADIDTSIAVLLSALYPVGSVYIGTQNTCPMAALITGSTWVLVSSGKALWTGDGTNADTTISAGLPDITGNLQILAYARSGIASGAFSATVYNGKQSTSNGGNYWAETGFSMNASNSNSIYGNSSTVQPPAYVVNVWRRTV